MDAVTEVKARLSIDDVIGGYIPLKRAGSNLKGLCPFHDEKTPSFNVSPDKGIYHCFGCSEGGDIFEFVMKMDGLDFAQTLEKLASKAGVDLSQYSRGSSDSKRKENLRKVIEMSAKYYQASLLKNSTALDYVGKKRGFNKAVIGDFQIGYAPNSGFALSDFLAKKDISKTDAIAAGVVVNRNGRVFDMFRGRVMVVLADQQGRPIGFNGRVLDDGLPKYINSAQNILYDKSRHVFGWHLAKDSIRKNDLAILVEGNYDVVTAHQFEQKNVVATAGTALTEQQLRTIKRLTDNVSLAFDQDAAGITATVRAIRIAQKVGVRLSVITIVGGKDPDEAIRNDVKKWQKAVEARKPAIDWVLRYYMQKYSVTSGGGKKDFSDAALELIRNISDPVEQEHYAGIVGKILDVTKEAVLRKMNNQNGAVQPREKQAAYHVTTIDEHKSLEESVLGLALNFGETRDALLQTESQDLYTDVSREEIDASIRAAQLKDPSEYAIILKFKAEELYSSWTPHERQHEMNELLTRLLKESKQRKQNALTAAIKQAEADGDTDKAAQLLHEYQATVLGIE